MTPSLTPSPILRDICRAVGSPKRVQILRLIRDGVKENGEIARRLKLSRSSMTQHANELETAGLIRRIPDGKRTRHELQNEAEALIVAFCLVCEAVDRHLAKLEAQRLLGGGG